MWGRRAVYRGRIGKDRRRGIIADRVVAQWRSTAKAHARCVRSPQMHQRGPDSARMGFRIYTD
eukprot:6983941-Lingulodinium_polyedra.AAC.1